MNSPEWKAILRLAGPIALAQVGQMVLGLVDIAIVGRLGATALAAAAAGHGVAILVSLFFMGIAMGLDPIVSQRLGAKDDDGAWRAFSDALRLTLLCVVPAVALVALVEWLTLRPNLGDHVLPAWLPMDREVAEHAIAYTWARMPGIIPFMLFGAYRAWFYANHLTRVMIHLTIYANVANAVLDYVFVFGDDGLTRLGLPALGIPAGGVAAAGAVTSAVSILSIAYLAPIALLRRRDAVLKTPRVTPPAASLLESHASGMRRIARLGVPIGTVIALEVGIFVLVSWMTGAFGPTAQAAQEIALKIASFTFMVTVGIGAAAAVRVGRAIGARDTAAARRSGFTALVISVLWMAICGLVLVAFPHRLAGVFTNDAAVIDVAVPLLRIAAVFQIFDGTQSAISGALRGAGDTRIPMLANLVAYWVVGLPISHFVAFRCGLGPAGLWIGLTAGLVVVAFLLTWRFHRLTRRDLARVG